MKTVVRKPNANTPIYRGVAATKDVLVPLAKLNFDRFKANPVILCHHNGQCVIGHCIEYQASELGITVDFYFDEKDALAKDICRAPAGALQISVLVTGCP